MQPSIDFNEGARIDKMDQLPILVDGVEVGKVIMHSNPTKAIQTARDAAFNISSTNETRFCSFSDGSYKKGRGGVAVVHRRQWLPSGWTLEQTGTHPNGDFLKQAWSYAHAIGSMAMEGVGVMEGIHAANKTIARDLEVLKGHNSTVTVRVTSDCRGMIRHVASNIKVKPKAMLTAPSRLIKRIREEIQMLHGHGIKVIVELHWCPRNKVPQMQIADRLAGQVMANGLGYSNANMESWGVSIKSDMSLEIESMVSGAPWPDHMQAPRAHDPSSALPTNSIRQDTKTKKQQRRKAQQAASTPKTPTDDSDAHPQLPLPAILLATKPGEYTPAVIHNGATIQNLEKPVPESPQKDSERLPRGPVTAETVKRKVEHEEGITEPRKRVYLSLGNEEENKNAVGEAGPEALPGTQYTCTMPAGGGMDPETKVFSWEMPFGDIRARLDVPCPFARMVVLATMEWRQERRMYLSTII